MLASQLCTFDDKTDSKLKWGKKNSSYGCSVQIVYFANISINDLPQFKSANVDEFTTKNTRSSVKCWDHCDKIKTIR